MESMESLYVGLGRDMVGLVTRPVYRYSCKPYSSLALLVWLQARAIPILYAHMRHHTGA